MVNLTTAKRLFALAPSFVFAAGGNAAPVFAALPPCRVRGVFVEIDASITNNHATLSQTVYPRQIARSIAQVRFKSARWNVEGTGRYLWGLYRAMTGKALGNAGVTIASLGSSAMRTYVYIPAADVYAADPLEGAQPHELLTGKSFEVTLASSSTIGTGGGSTQVITSATYRFYAVCAEPAPGTLPTSVRLGYTDWTGTDANVKSGGRFSHLFIFDEADDTVTLTEYATIGVTMGDGSEVIPNGTRAQWLLNAYNDEAAWGASQDNELEQLPQDSVLILPLITAPRGYKQSQLPFGDSGQTTVRITGTVTSTRFGWRILEPRSTVEENNDIAEMDAASGRKRDAGKVPRGEKTLSKVSLRGPAGKRDALRATLPIRFEV